MFEANTVHTANESELWVRFQVGSLPLIECAEILLGDKRTKISLKGQGRSNTELNTCGISASSNVPTIFNTQHRKTPRIF